LVADFATEDEKEFYYSKVDEYIDKDYKPCSCLKFDCTEEEIKRCHGKLTYNNGQGDDKKVNNTCASFISRHRVKGECKVEVATDIVDEAIEEAINENTTIMKE
jgi:predicted transcriptional regulator